MEARDSVYSFEIARRSVGRAALHLGIESMTEEALDTMANILLEYLNRLGKSLSHLVEASGRTSAHVNVLDAFQAAQLVASPAIQRLHLVDPSEGEGDVFGKKTQLQVENNWQGLAAFCFGPKWHEERQPEQSKGPAGGKVGPSITDSSTKNEGGWDAPFLDEVSNFPQASQACANPHSLPPRVALSLHVDLDSDGDDEASLTKEGEKNQAIPDSAFTKTWGSVSENGHKKRSADDMDLDEDTLKANSNSSQADPPAKRVKIADNGRKEAPKTDGEHRSTPVAVSSQRPSYVPSFYPPPPTATSSTSNHRTVVETSTSPVPAAAPSASINNRDVQSSDVVRGVRSSLVEMGQYWGSGWDAPESKDKSQASKLAVPLGRVEGDKSTQIVPLSRASGSRVSKILEGSMDASTIQ